MKPTVIEPNMTVDEIMRRWPTTIRVFIRNEMLCIGCPIGVFHAVKDACEVALHIANGMYGLILVEPEEGLPPVDREFYVMQGEIYTEEPFGSSGLLTESYKKLLNERPDILSSTGMLGCSWIIIL